LNDKGDVVGFWFGTFPRGFIRSARGEVTKFDVPNSVNTTPVAINGRRTIAGYYKDNVNYRQHAFIRSGDGTFTTFDVPAIAFALNAGGAVAGIGSPDYQKGQLPSFARDRNGRVHAIQLPKTDIYAQGINADGVVVGYLLQRHKQYGFIWTP